jgi:hypothetical protein
MKKIVLAISFLLQLAFVPSVFAMGSQPPERSPASKYSHLDPKRYIAREALQAAVDYFDANQSKFENKRYITVIDFSLHSGQERFFVVNMQSGAVERLHTSHGSGSDPDHNGYADRFSNKSGSYMTSLGAYVTGATYNGQHGLSLYLDGLSSTNSRARSRAIVVHGAWYVDPSMTKMGRSQGCPALPIDETSRIVNLIKGKSLLFAWNG